MPVIGDLRTDIQLYLKTHGLLRKWQKAKALFENDPSHPSLHTELLEPKHRLIYSFRLNGKHRAIFIRPSGDIIEIIAVTKHYRK
jgi:Txe/YoeB family toxin of Txe-Axe toxin-antitoxin module